MTHQALRFLIFSASLRKDSLNTRLAKIASAAIEKNGGTVDYATMADFDCQSFNQDLETNGIVPDGATEFRKRILDNDAFIISSPEYNGSMPGCLKNVVEFAVFRCEVLRRVENWDCPFLIDTQQ